MAAAVAQPTRPRIPSSAMRPDEGPPLNSGVMRGYLKTDGNAASCFWFELSNERLSYFENKDCPEPLGSLNIDDMRSIQARKRNQREYVMRINTVDSSFEKTLSETSTMIRESSAATPGAPSTSSAALPAGASTGSLGSNGRMSTPTRSATTTTGMEAPDSGGMLSWMRKMLPGGDPASAKRSPSDAANSASRARPPAHPARAPPAPAHPLHTSLFHLLAWRRHGVRARGADAV